jgi:hypothetical protein
MDEAEFTGEGVREGSGEKCVESGEEVREGSGESGDLSWQESRLTGLQVQV